MVSNQDELPGMGARMAPGKKTNPMLRLHGPGPDGTRCKTCKHLRALKYQNTFYKCALRYNTHGKSTDQRVNWPACGAYVEREE